MISKIDIERLQRFRRGNVDKEEVRHIHSIFLENEGSREFKQHIEDEFDTYLEQSGDSSPDLSYLLDRINHNIHLSEKRGEETVVRRFYRWYSVAAAVLFIPLLIAGSLWFAGQKYNEAAIAESTAASELSAPLGSRISFLLPDGTKGWLNSGSALEYQTPFCSNRQVEVTGEAWFDVAHDADHPFEIALANSRVKVLGTKFNVSAYPDEDFIEVVLEEGQVEFTAPGLKSGIIMKPDERLVLVDGTVNMDVIDAAEIGAWKEGKLILQGDPMDEVARRIGRWYNVDVKLMDEALEKHVYHGTFHGDSLEEVLEYLSMTSPIHYEIVPGKKMDDGTIQKKSVLIYEKDL